MKEYRVVSLDQPGYFVIYARKQDALDRIEWPRDVMGLRKKIQSRDEDIQGDDSTWTDCE